MSTASIRSAQRAEQWRERITRQERGGVLPGARHRIANVLLVAQPAGHARIRRNLASGRGVPLEPDDVRIAVVAFSGINSKAATSRKWDDDFEATLYEK